MAAVATLIGGGGMLAPMTAIARGGFPHDDPWNPQHVSNLPAELWIRLQRLARACGAAPAAAHYFAVSIDTSGTRFMSLHFEDFGCANRQSICKPAGCLHEIYASNGGAYRRVLSLYAQDVTMKRSGAGVAIDIESSAGLSSVVWDGSRFAVERR